jgi:hypothetical protein
MGKHTRIELTEEQRTEPGPSIRSRKAPARINTRAHILLLSYRSGVQKRADREVAAANLCSQSTALYVHRRFLAEALARALSDQGWPGPPLKFTEEVQAQREASIAVRLLAVEGTVQRAGGQVNLLAETGGRVQ